MQIRYLSTHPRGEGRLRVKPLSSIQAEQALQDSDLLLVSTPKPQEGIQAGP